MMTAKTSFNRFAFLRKKNQQEEQKDEDLYRAGQWKLVWWKFRRHRLAQFSLVVLGIFYFFALFAEFMAPYTPLHRLKNFVAMQPSKVHIRDVNGNFRRPFVYGVIRGRDPETYRPVYEEDTTIIYPLNFFVRGDPYKFWGLVELDIHFIGTGTEDAPLLLLGSDSIGRDLCSRIIYGTRISLTI